MKALPSQDGLSTRFACNKDVFHWQNDGLTYRPELLFPFLPAKIDLSILVKDVSWMAGKDLVTEKQTSVLKPQILKR